MHVYRIMHLIHSHLWQEKVKKWSERMCIIRSTHLTFELSNSKWRLLSYFTTPCSILILSKNSMASCTSSSHCSKMHLWSCTSFTHIFWQEKGQEVEWIVWLLNSQKVQKWKACARFSYHALRSVSLSLSAHEVHSHLLTRDGQKLEWNDVPHFSFFTRRLRRVHLDQLNSLMTTFKYLTLMKRFTTYDSLTCVQCRSIVNLSWGRD